MDRIIIALVRQLAGWVVGKKFFAKVFEAVALADGMYDLDGDGKKATVLEEVTRAGLSFGKRQFNRALELALIIVERK